MLRLFTKSILPWMVASSFALGISVAQAHVHHRYKHHAVIHHAIAPVARPAPACVAWCAFDLVPCDPPEYKIADGRCAPRD